MSWPRKSRPVWTDWCCCPFPAGRSVVACSPNGWPGWPVENPRIIPFGTVHPNSDTLADDVAEVLDLGLSGLKLHSLVQFFEPLSKDAGPAVQPYGKGRFGPAYGLHEPERGRSGPNPVWPNLWTLPRSAGVETGTRQIARIAEAHPGLKIIAAHLGHNVRLGTIWTPCTNWTRSISI